MLRNRGCVSALSFWPYWPSSSFIGLDLYTDLVWFETLGVASVLWKRIAVRVVAVCRSLDCSRFGAGCQLVAGSCDWEAAGR